MSRCAASARCDLPARAGTARVRALRCGRPPRSVSRPIGGERTLVGHITAMRGVALAFEMAAVRERRERSARTRPLLSLDPDLGQLLDPERREAAERELHVRVTRFP